MRRRVFLTATAAAGFIRPARGETRTFTRGSWRLLLAEHAGRPLIVHFWGLTCGPCLTELPDWGAFARANPSVDLVTIAADPMPQAADRMAETLGRAGLSSVESWSFGGGFSARLYFEVDPAWQGELPRTTLRDAHGRQDTWIGAADFSRVRTWLGSQSS